MMETIRAVRYERTVPIGAPDIPKFWFFISTMLAIAFTRHPTLIEIKGALTYPPASRDLFIISKKEDRMIAGDKRHSKDEPISISEEGKSTVNISLPYVINPTVIGAAINVDNLIELSSASIKDSTSFFAIASVKRGRCAIEIGVRIARARLNIGTARVV
jgi:hypothetical protein